MKHFAYPATIFSCVRQPLQGGENKNKKVSKHQTAPQCAWWPWSPVPSIMFLLVLVLPLPHTRAPSPAPSLYPPCPLHTLPVKSHLPLQVHPRLCTGSHQPLQPIPETSIARKGCSEATATSAAHRRTDSKAHPPPLIRLRSESTSSAPSMATSSCRKRRNLVWKPLLRSIQARLLAQLGGGVRSQAAARNVTRAGTTSMPAWPEMSVWSATQGYQPPLNHKYVRAGERKTKTNCWPARHITLASSVT